MRYGYEKIFERLEMEATKRSENECEVAVEIIEKLKRQCPTSLKVTFETLKRGASMSLGESLRMEYRLTARCVRRKDCTEGVREAVITKTRKPKWEPSELDQVSNEYVESLFRPLKQDLGIEELQLPVWPGDKHVGETQMRLKL